MNEKKRNETLCGVTFDCFGILCTYLLTRNYMHFQTVISRFIIVFKIVKC